MMTNASFWTALKISQFRNFLLLCVLYGVVDMMKRRCQRRFMIEYRRRRLLHDYNLHKWIMHEIHEQLNCRWHHSHRDFIILNTHWTVEVSSKLLWRFGLFFPELNNVLMRMIFWYWADSPRQRRSTTTRNDALRKRERESLGIYPSPCFSKLAC